MCEYFKRLSAPWSLSAIVVKTDGSVSRGGLRMGIHTEMKGSQRQEDRLCNSKGQEEIVLGEPEISLSLYVSDEHSVSPCRGPPVCSTGEPMGAVGISLLLGCKKRSPAWRSMSIPYYWVHILTDLNASFQSTLTTLINNMSG